MCPGRAHSAARAAQCASPVTHRLSAGILLGSRFRPFEQAAHVGSPPPVGLPSVPAASPRGRPGHLPRRRRLPSSPRPRRPSPFLVCLVFLVFSCHFRTVTLPGRWGRFLPVEDLGAQHTFHRLPSALEPGRRPAAHGRPGALGATPPDGGPARRWCFLRAAPESSLPPAPRPGPPPAAVLDPWGPGFPRGGAQGADWLGRFGPALGRSRRSHGEQPRQRPQTCFPPKPDSCQFQ